MCWRLARGEQQRRGRVEGGRRICCGLLVLTLSLLLYSQLDPAAAILHTELFNRSQINVRQQALAVRTHGVCRTCLRPCCRVQLAVEALCACFSGPLAITLPC